MSFIKIDLNTQLNGISSELELNLTEQREVVRGVIEVRDGRGILVDTATTDEISVQIMIEKGNRETNLCYGVGGSNSSFMSVTALSKLMQSDGFKLTLPKGKHKFLLRHIKQGSSNINTQLANGIETGVSATILLLVD